MKQGLRSRFWPESLLAAVTAALAIVTFIQRDWIELVFGVEPDNHDGWLEWLTVITLLAASAISTLFAIHEWRRPPATTR